MVTENDYELHQKYIALGDAAYMTFRKMLNAPANENTAYQFYKFLLDGGKFKRVDAAWKIALKNEEAIRRMKILMGPHARTYYKAWLAKNDEV